MKKYISLIGIATFAVMLALAGLGLKAELAVVRADVEEKKACRNGEVLSAKEAKEYIENGKIRIDFFVDQDKRKAISNIINNTGCDLQVSQATYKMYDRRLSTQELFDVSPDNAIKVTIAPKSRLSLSTNLPECMSQSDVYIGQAPRELFDDNRYGDRTLAWVFDQNTGGWSNASGNFCKHAPTTATLKVVKTVVNAGGGTKDVSDFRLFVNDDRVTSGEKLTLNPGTYRVREVNLPNYEAGNWGGDCNSDGRVTLKAGDVKVCRITNTYVPPAPQKGCIAIKKEAYDVNGNRIQTVQPFTFKLDNNQTYTTNESGDVTISNVTPGVHYVREIIPSGWNLTGIIPASNDGRITVTAGSNCATITFKNKRIPQSLSGYCVPSKTSALTGETVTFTASSTGGTGSYSYVWSGSDNLSGNRASTTKSYSTAGTKNAHVVISSGSQSVAADCSTNISTPSSGNLGVICYASASSVLVGNSMTYRAEPSGGTGSYTYSWTGDSGFTTATNTQSVSAAYGNIGTRGATVTVTSGNQTASAQCFVNVTQPVLCGNCGGGGGGGGGGYTPPTVSVTRETPPGRVAGVYLSQVPYTGIGSNLKIALFILALFGWSTWLAYIVIKWKARKHGVTVSQMFGVPQNSLAFSGSQSFASARPQASSKEKIKGAIPVVNASLREHVPSAKEIKRDEADVSPFLKHLTQEIKHSKPQPVVPNLPTDNTYEKIFSQTRELSTLGDITHSLEIRARELQTIVSADGLEIIAKASHQNKHTASIILNQLVELYKGVEHETDGEWMVLNGEKISTILFSTYITMTPVFVGWLVEGNERKVMSFIRMLQVQGHTVRDFIANAVVELDKVYRYRVENTGDADAKILNLTMRWSHEELEQAIHTLVSSIDQTYSSLYASIKIALVKVLDMSKVKYFA